ncbi:hypothetical protein PC114_g11067 [Phytophthora cactorum]|nr:hypothetical protein PC112_g18267 [Phytophthora cactorum]KAG2906654.1 hypothetical protein PC114_g11067 [Phytophthora cactorum]KAG3065824.1 hypothetical protein PC122_g18008 [Phytophthora cactorum]
MYAVKLKHGGPRAGQEGPQTADEVIKKATQTVYEASFKNFLDFCVTNSYPDPRHEPHHEIPVVLVAYLQSISASSYISLQTAKKARSAREDESGAKHGYGNPARDPYVRQFMRGLKKQKKASEYVPAKAVPISLNMITVLHAILDTPTGAKGFSEESRVMFKAVSSFGLYGMCRINEVLPLKWKDLSLRPYRTSVAAPHEVTEYGTKKVLKTNDAATGCEKVRVGWRKKMSKQVLITLLNGIALGLNRDGKQVTGYVRKHWTNTRFTSHTHFAVPVPNTVSGVHSLVVAGRCV